MSMKPDPVVVAPSVSTVVQLFFSFLKDTFLVYLYFSMVKASNGEWGENQSNDQGVMFHVNRFDCRFIWVLWFLWEPAGSHGSNRNKIANGITVETGPGGWPVSGWTSLTGRPSPIFKTMIKPLPTSYWQDNFHFKVCRNYFLAPWPLTLAAESGAFSSSSS